MSLWISIVTLGVVVLLGLSYWIHRRGKLYENKELREVLSEEMKLVLRNERSENLIKKQRFEAELRSATDARLPTKTDKKT